MLRHCVRRLAAQIAAAPSSIAPVLPCTWFHNDLYAVTIGGGFMNNPGRYLALTPPINGATAASGSPYFTQQPGQKLYQWDAQLNFQYMPKDWITWWTEATFRHSSVPYWSGSGGVTASWR